MKLDSFLSGFCLTSICCVSVWIVGIVLFFRRIRRSEDVAARQTSNAPAFKDDPAVKPFVRDRPRIYTILHKPTNQVVRAVGYLWTEALQALGWTEEEVIGVDLGPTTQPHSLVKFQEVALRPGDFGPGAKAD